MKSSRLRIIPASILAPGLPAHAAYYIVSHWQKDEACSDYIESLLTGEAFDWVDRVAAIVEDETAQKFLRGDQAYLPKEDVPLCLQRDIFDFVLRAVYRGSQVIVEKISPEP
jgi:hypothetical protein